MAFNILLVDDSRTVRMFLEKTLRLSGVAINQIYHAADGREGLETVKTQWLDLIFTDINMPVMNGVEMIEELHQQGLLEAIPVVIVSTEGSKTRLDGLMQKGVKAYLRKPFRPEQFREIVLSLLGEPHA